MASLLRFTPEKGAYVIKTGSREECAKECVWSMKFDKFAHKSIFVVADEKGFQAFDGARQCALVEGNWK